MGLAFGLQSGLGLKLVFIQLFFSSFSYRLLQELKTLISDPNPMTIVAATIIANAGFADDPSKALPLIILSFALVVSFKYYLDLFVLLRCQIHFLSCTFRIYGGIGVIIILTQWHTFLGGERPGGILDIIMDLHTPIIEYHWSSIILGV